ncbi:MAG: hypothetical protein HRU43_03815 [Simkaniaceae bacterium]|nr:hypothetical protein [Simkaniaceae bacterium]
MNQTINDATRSQLRPNRNIPPLQIKVEKYLEVPVELITLRLGTQKTD